MTQLILRLDPDELTFDEMIDIQEGKLRDAKRILVKFAVDDNNRPLPEDEANALVGQLNLAQMRAVFTDFSEQIGAAMSDTLPKAPAPKSRRR